MRHVMAAALLACAGCSLDPAYVRPAPPVPPSWPVGDAYLRTSEAVLPSVTYRDVFRDPRLRRIIERALATNRDLRVAAANIEAARAQYRVRRAEQFPEIDSSAGFTRSDSGRTSSVTGTGAGSGAVVTSGGGARSRYTADVGVTAFELDLFGRLRSLSGAARDRFFGTEAAARATRLTLVGDIADAWLTYAADKSLLLIAQRTSASAERSVTLTRARLEGGIAPRTDLRQAQQVLAQAQADLAEQRTALAQDVNALTLLVGSAVQPALLPGTIEEAAATVAPLAAGVDSGVLLRRPDVVQAEYELRATNAEIGAARAALFPRIALTGLVGFASDALSSLFTGGAFSYSIAPDASYPIFRAGAGRAGVAQARAQRDAALASYEKAIQTAFREAADALARRGTIADQARATELLAEAAADTFRLADARYRGGIDTFLASLDAQRSLYAAQRTLARTRLVAASNLVTLYRTLGGDDRIEATPDGPVAAAQ